MTVDTSPSIDSPPPPRKQSKKWWWISGIVAAFVLGLGIGSAPDNEPQEAVSQLAATATASPTPTATVTASLTPTPTPEPTPLATSEPAPTETLPVRTAPTPIATVSPSEVFRTWYRLQDYPNAAYASTLEFVHSGCKALREGATAEDVYLVVLTSVVPSQYKMMGSVLGAGVQSFCPDQFYKFE